MWIFFFILSEGSSSSPLTEFNLGIHFFHVVNPFHEYFYESLKKHCFYPFQSISKYQLEKSAGHVKLQGNKANKTHNSLLAMFFKFRVPQHWDWESCY